MRRLENELVYIALALIGGLNVIFLILETITFFKDLQNEDIALFREATDSIRRLDDLLNTPPIAEIHLVASNSSCPKGTDSISIGDWPGTRSGCYCDSYIKGPQLKLSCDPSEMCLILEPLEEQSLLFWKNHRFCVRRSGNLTKLLPNNTCSKGIRCSGTSFCVDRFDDCPIHHFRLAFDESGYGSLALSKSPQSLGETPMIDVSVSFQGIMCINGNRRSFKGDDYILLRKGIRGCGKYGFDNITTSVMDESTEEEFYDSNNFDTTVFPILPHYNESVRGDKVYLNVQHMVIQDPRCSNFSVTELLGVAERISDFNDDEKVVNLSLWWFCFMIVALFSLLTLDRFNSGFLQAVAIIAGFGCCLAELCHSLYAWSWTEFVRDREEQFSVHFGFRGCFDNVIWDQVRDDMIKAITRQIFHLRLKLYAGFISVLPFVLLLVILWLLWKGKIQRKQLANVLTDQNAESTTMSSSNTIKEKGLLKKHVDQEMTPISVN